MRNVSWQYILLVSLIVATVSCRSEQGNSTQQNVTKVERTATNNSTTTNSLQISSRQGSDVGLSLAQNNNSAATNSLLVSNEGNYAASPPFTQNSQSKSKYLKSLKNYLTGTWKKDEPTGCEVLWIEFPVAKDVCIVGNNIFADVRYKLDTKNQKVYMYFDKTADLSEAAMKIPWRDIDKNKPIAVIDISKISSSGLIEVKWIGFLNKRTGEIYDYGKEDLEGVYRKRRDDENE